MSNEDLVQQVVAALMPMVDAKIAEAMAAPPDPTPPAPEVPAEVVAPAGEGEFEADPEYGKALSDASMKYMGEDGAIDNEGLEGHLDTFDDDDKQHYAAYAGASEDEAVKTMYSKASGYFAKGRETEPEPNADAKPADKDGSVQRYRKENAELKLHNQKLESANRKLAARSDRMTIELAEANKAARYSKRREAFASLVTEGFMLDIDDEMALVSDFSEAQFKRHVEEVIPTRYSKLNTLTRTLGQDEVTADPRMQKKETDSQKYAKRAGELVQKAREAGIPEGRPETTYATVLDKLVKHNGKIPETNGAAV